ncbi:hypothetical protein [Streptomyces sp. NPDC096324]|uniref:hypothetical protein n=1 Tax=Streptomyces sp. NPDC096324 TaxID=3366085 RepID=UPI00381F9091
MEHWGSFGIGDVLEMAQRITDRVLNTLTHAWLEPPASPDGAQGQQCACRLTPGEVDAATLIATADLVALALG